VPLSDTGSSPRFDLARDLSLAHAIDPRLAGNLAPDLALDLALNRALSLSYALPVAISRASPCLSLPSPMNELLSVTLGCSTTTTTQRTTPEQGGERLKEWWNANGQTWAEN